jgi:hypothetical protein
MSGVINHFLLNSYGVLVLFVHLPRAALRLHGVIHSQLLRNCFTELFYGIVLRSSFTE